MKKLNLGLIFGALFLLAACVTINVYFPAAAAERAAEKFVDDVLGEEEGDSSYRFPLEPAGDVLLLASAGVLDFLVPSAQAQEPEIDINTPQINAIKARMAQRHRQELASLYDAGAIGFTADGLVAIHDRSAVPLAERRKLESLVAEENRDRRTVYREIAVANGHPEWEQDIQKTFAKEWLANARPGWYYQDANGNWRQK
ncbi:MAG: YdbL family protein [Xanthomonadales bacterium]|nr:YdbL family protein [Xanthomonadales bacterium]